jgi:hypothetical protein
MINKLLEYVGLSVTDKKYNLIFSYPEMVQLSKWYQEKRYEMFVGHIIMKDPEIV